MLIVNWCTENTFIHICTCRYVCNVLEPVVYNTHYWHLTTYPRSLLLLLCLDKTDSCCYIPNSAVVRFRQICNQCIAVSYSQTVYIWSYVVTLINQTHFVLMN